MMLRGYERRSKAFLVRLTVGAISGQSPEKFAEQLEIMSAANPKPDDGPLCHKCGYPHGWLASCDECVPGGGGEE